MLTMKGKIIGPPVTIIINDVVPKARLAVAVELQTKVCGSALLPSDVFPLLGTEVKIRMNECKTDLFDFFIVKK